MGKRGFQKELVYSFFMLKRLKPFPFRANPINFNCVKFFSVFHFSY